MDDRLKRWVWNDSSVKSVRPCNIRDNYKIKLTSPIVWKGFFNLVCLTLSSHTCNNRMPISQGLCKYYGDYRKLFLKGGGCSYPPLSRNSKIYVAMKPLPPVTSTLVIYGKGCCVYWPITIQMRYCGAKNLLSCLPTYLFISLTARPSFSESSQWANSLVA